MGSRRLRTTRSWPGWRLSPIPGTNQFVNGSNTLARRAVEGTDFECMQETLKGPILLAFAKDDPGAAARVIKDFAKEHKALQAVSLAAGGQLIPGSDLAKLADLPTLDQARAMLLGVFMAPMSQLVRTLAEPPAMLARTLSARGEQEAA